MTEEDRKLPHIIDTEEMLQMKKEKQDYLNKKLKYS